MTTQVVEKAKKAPKKKYTPPAPPPIRFTPFVGSQVAKRVDYDWDDETKVWERKYPILLAFHGGINGHKKHGVSVRVLEGDRLRKSNEYRGGRVRQINFQILLDAEEYTAVSGNKMVPGKRYILVAQSAGILYLRWLFLANGEEVTTLSEYGRRWAGRRGQARDEIAKIIEAAMATLIA